MPGIYVHKIYTPFFLQILSVLQELNIAFHHNKKLIKNKPDRNKPETNRTTSNKKPIGTN